jgi:hypothetical protein
MENTEQTPKMWWGRPGFYDYPVENGIEITVRYWEELLKGQENGYEIGEDECGYPILVEPGPKTLEEWREAKLAEIAAYDRSDSVNRFYVDDVPAWFDKATRGGLRSSLDAEESVGKTATTLWFGAEPARPVEMPIADVRRKLANIEVYAKEVFDTTGRHRSAIYALTTIEELKAYDYTAGYPDKLRF